MCTARNKFVTRDVFTPVCHSVHSGGVSASGPEGVSASATPWADTPLGRHPSSADTPSGQTPSCPVDTRIHPPTQCMLGYTPFCTVHAGIRSTSGRYASYWNAFLLVILLMVMSIYLHPLV